MRVRAILMSFVMISVLVFALEAQQSAGRDPQALTVLQNSFRAMGGILPTDAVVTGTVTIVAGSKTDNGTIRILARGLEQYAEEIQTSDGFKREAYSKGIGAETEGTSRKEKSLEWTANGDLAGAPIHVVAAALAMPDLAVEYIGLEQENAVALHHLRVWDTYASRPKLQSLSRFSVKDLWVDTITGFLRRLSFERREAGGAVDGIGIVVFYSDYRDVGGTFYPFHIEKSLNGTPWLTIQIEKIAFNTGLSESDFSIH
ncbi:MAG: hypothetical protein HY234_10685 [Acidobacteria bacterium]|nr:hypothetical protein [Acidobacteriota bacterium]MBI3663497.1 hypothetical protein [Acidobacteriota bacterium]